MELFYEKLFATACMLYLTIVCCYAPYFMKKKWQKSSKIIGLLNCLAGGVVLGALLMHMIPEIVAGHDHSHPVPSSSVPSGPSAGQGANFQAFLAWLDKGELRACELAPEMALESARRL